MPDPLGQALVTPPPPGFPQYTPQYYPHYSADARYRPTQQYQPDDYAGGDPVRYGSKTPLTYGELFERASYAARLEAAGFRLEQYQKNLLKDFPPEGYQGKHRSRHGKQRSRKHRGDSDFDDDPLARNLESTRISGDYVELPSTRARFPFAGFGTLGIGKAERAQWILAEAVRAGFRVIDTSPVHGNERAVGNLINNHPHLKREDFFVIGQIFVTQQGTRSQVQAAVRRSLKRLRTRYFDLFLVNFAAEDAGQRKLTWQALEDMLDAGAVRALGVANFTLDNLREMPSYAKTLPVVHQLQLNPFVYAKQRDIVNFCKVKGIQVQVYSPLGGSQNNHAGDYRVLEVANAVVRERHGGGHPSGAQVLLRWALQHNAAFLTTSSNEDHIKENTQLFDFELSQDQMLTLNLCGGAWADNPDPDVQPIAAGSSISTTSSDSGTDSGGGFDWQPTTSSDDDTSDDDTSDSIFPPFGGFPGMGHPYMYHPYMMQQQQQCAVCPPQQYNYNYGQGQQQRPGYNYYNASNFPASNYNYANANRASPYRGAGYSR